MVSRVRQLILVWTIFFSKINFRTPNAKFTIPQLVNIGTVDAFHIWTLEGTRQRTDLRGRVLGSGEGSQACVLSCHVCPRRHTPCVLCAGSCRF